MYKTESTLGLVGSILCIISAVIGLIVSVIASAALAYVGAAADQLSQAGVDVSGVSTAAVGVGIGVLIIGVVFAIAAIVLGFMGTSKLKKDNKQGGILLIVAGALIFVSLFMGGVYSIVSLVLFLIGGIMAVTKKPIAPQA